MISLTPGSPGWARLILTRSREKNKLTVPFLKRMTSLVEEILASPGTWQLITIESESDSIFAAGADMNELLALSPESAAEYARTGQTLMELIEGSPIPVIAQVCGPCIGGGFDLAMSCHQILATPEAVFAHPGVFLGIVTGFGGTVRLAEKVGQPEARQLMLTGRRIKGKEAFKMGLVHKLYSSGHAMRHDIRVNLV